ncbi:MAG: hypothetical protein ACPLWC_04845 [Candidatus Woesearchaeota archaeon]
MGKKLDWQDYALIFLLLIILVYEFQILKDLKQLPGPLYGGDVYYHFGNVLHIYYGGSVFKSNHYLNEWQHYPWLLYVLIFLFSKIFFISILKAAILFPLAIVAFSIILSYILGRFLFKDKTIALLFAISYALGIPASVPTSFFKYVVILLQPISFYLIFNNQLKNKADFINIILAGIFLGVSGLSHVAAFLGISLFLVLLFLYETTNNKKIEFKKSKKMISLRLFFNTAKKYLIIFLVGIPIALLYWAPLIIYYHGKTLNPWQEYIYYSPSGNLSIISDALKNYFFNFQNFYQSIISLLVIAGILSLFAFKSERNSLIKILFLTGFLGLIHPIITQPLIKTSFGYFAFNVNFILLRSILAFSGVYLIYKFNKEMIYKIGVLIFSSLLVAGGFFIEINNFKKDRWSKIGFSYDDLTKAQFEIANFIIQNTNKDEVIITPHGETSFAINALTGRKVLFLRRTHASTFVDANKREADAAIILYGNNESLRRKLLSKYNIKYFYYDFYALQNIYACLQYWENLSDEMYSEYSYSCLRTSLDYKDYLEQNGIEVKEVYARLNVAAEDAPKFRILAIKPNEIKLNLSQIRAVSYQNITYFGFYKIT